MGKAMCELCQQKQEKEMRLGVSLCKNCILDFGNAMDGNKDAITHLSNPQNFPLATESAQKQIIGYFAKRVENSEAAYKTLHEFKQTQEAQKQQPVKKEEYAQSVGVTLKETVNDTGKLLDTLYTDIGKKVKKLAKIVFVFETIVAFISGIFLWIETEDFLMMLAIFLLSPIFALITSRLLYAFGELVEKTTENERNTKNIYNILSKYDEPKNI